MKLTVVLTNLMRFHMKITIPKLTRPNTRTCLDPTLKGAWIPCERVEFQTMDELGDIPGLPSVSLLIIPPPEQDPYTMQLQSIISFNGNM